MKHISQLINAIGLYRNPFSYVLDKAGILGNPSDTRIVTLRNNTKYRVHCGNSDVNSIDEIYQTDIYKEALANIMPDDVVIDIGANIGIFTVAAAKRAFNGHVIGFEPNPVLQSVIKENMWLNHLFDAVTISTKCIAGNEGTSDFYFEPEHWGGASLAPKNNSIVTKVSCLTLPKALTLYGIDHVDLLKMDVEGAELEILQSIDKDTFNCTDRMIIEYHEPAVSEREIADILTGAGFHITKSNDTNAFYAQKP